MNGRTPPPRGRRPGSPGIAPPLVAGLAVLAALASLGGVVRVGRWSALAVLAVAVVLASAELVRRRGRRLAPTLVGALAGGVVVTALTVAAARGSADSSLTARLADLFEGARAAVAEGSAPITATAGLEIALVLGAVLLTLVVDAVGLTLRRPGIAALALAGVWSVTLVFDRPPASAVVLAGGGTLVLLLWSARPTGPATRPTREVASAVVVAAIVAVLAFVLTPLAALAPGWAGTQLPARWGSVPSSGLLSLSTDLDLRDDLGDRPDRTVLSYRTDLAGLGPLRTSTVVRFSGTRWESSPSAALRPMTDVLWPEPTESVPTALVEIQVGDLNQTTLPIPLDPRIVDAGPRWEYDQVNDIVRGRGARSAGESYTVRVAPRDLSADSLRADRVHEIGPSAWELEVLSPFAAQIAEQSRTVVGDASTAYDQAVALQSWFRDGTLFTYSTDVPPARTDDAVWDFLRDRRGYCVQFATSMAIMARTLGIPARVGVGFLPGDRGTDGVWRVSARKAHAWPELWFAEAGWVRFEPTPAVQTDAPPAYADPNLGAPAAASSDVPTVTATPRPSVSAATPTPAAGGATPTSEGSIAPLVAAGIALLVIAGAGIAVRLRRPPLSPERAWAQVRAAAAGRVSWSDSTTPRQAAAMLRGSWEVDDGSSGAAAAEALQRLTSVVESARYAPRPAEWTRVELEEWVAAITAEINRVGRAASPSALPVA